MPATLDDVTRPQLLGDLPARVEQGTGPATRQSLVYLVRPAGVNPQVRGGASTGHVVAGVQGVEDE